MVDHQFYVDTFKGSLVPADHFEKHKILMNSLLNYYTFNRINEGDDSVKYCLCELVEESYRQAVIEKEGTGLIKSESVSKHSITYALPNEGLSPSQIMSHNQRLYSIVVKWFGNSNLMYRGVR